MEEVVFFTLVVITKFRAKLLRRDHKTGNEPTGRSVSSAKPLRANPKFPGSRFLISPVKSHRLLYTISNNVNSFAFRQKTPSQVVHK